MAIALDFNAVLQRWPMLLDGALLTIELAAVSSVLGMAAGTVCAIGRRQPEGWARRTSGFYVELIRNTPFLVQIFIVYFGLSSLGLRLSAITVSVMALSINAGAYVAEIMRAGMDAVPRGQIEAAECLALSRWQVYWHVVLRPGMERVYPALTSQFVLLMLASSVTSQISAEELTGAANFIQSDTFRAFETYIVIAVLYVLLSLLLRSALWGLGQLIFPRRRRLGTPL